MNVILKSVTILDPESPHHKQKCDVLISNGVFEKIAPKIENPDNRREVSLEDLHISQGWFDSSVSFGEPGYEERETLTNGLKTAGFSGFTAVAVNPNTDPVVDSKADIQFLTGKAKQNAVSIYPIGALTSKGSGTALAELYDMKNAGAVAFYDYQKPIENPNLLKLALQYSQGFNGLIIAFCQENSIAKNGVVNEEESSTRLGLKGIPALAEELHVSRNLFLLEYSGGKLHFPTISTKKSVELIREAKKKGLDVSCSVSVNNLLLEDKMLENFDTNLKVLPPLRTPEDNKALLKGLKDGTIDGVTSDHNPIDIEHKKTEFDHAMFGSIGLESCFGALNTLVTPEEAVGFLNGLKKRFGLEQTPIAEGKKVNISLFSTNREWVFEEKHIISSSKNAALLGQKLKGRPYGIYANKKLMLHQE